MKKQVSSTLLWITSWVRMNETCLILGVTKSIIVTSTIFDATGNRLLPWQHEELYYSYGPSSMPIIFEFFWVALPYAVPPLIADHGIMLPQLLKVDL